jgi:hypothetical protein
VRAWLMRAEALLWKEEIIGNQRDVLSSPFHNIVVKLVRQNSHNEALCSHLDAFLRPGLVGMPVTVQPVACEPGRSSQTDTGQVFW